MRFTVSLAEDNPGGPAPGKPLYQREAMDTLPDVPLVKLEGYQGPLDLLLALIRRQQINIYDIPIASITQQYLEYLHALEKMNVDTAGEFVLMAATLIQIKSRMLLPRDPAVGPGEQEDPRRELVDKLLQHERFKIAAEMLESRRALEGGMWTQPGSDEPQPAEQEERAPIVASVLDIIRVFGNLLERARKQPAIQIHREPVTVAQMVEHVKQILMERVDPVRLEDIAEGYVERQMLVALLLALLEMMRLREVVLRQEELFGAMTIGRGARFSDVLRGNAVKGNRGPGSGEEH